MKGDNIKVYKIRRYYFTCANGNKYSLKLSCDFKTRLDGKYQVNYLFKRCNTYNNNILFGGNDSYASPMINNPIGIKSAMSLLGFLTLKEGDTDKEYFDNYSPSQLEFSQSYDCEELQLIVYDYENKKG